MLTSQKTQISKSIDYHQTCLMSISNFNAFNMLKNNCPLSSKKWDDIFSHLMSKENVNGWVTNESCVPVLIIILWLEHTAGPEMTPARAHRWSVSCTTSVPCMQSRARQVMAGPPIFLFLASLDPLTDIEQTPVAKLEVKSNTYHFILSHIK